MADDEDAIYIDVIPKVDEAAADSAVERLKDKFSDVAKDVGGEFMDALNSSGALDELGTKLGQVLSDPLKDLSDTIGLDLENPLEKLLKRDMSGALADIGTQIGGQLATSIGEPLQNVADTIGLDLEAAIGKVMDKDWGGLAGLAGKGLGGKLGTALGLDDMLGGLGGLDNIVDKTRTIADSVRAIRSGDLSGALSGANALTGGGLQPAVDLHSQLHETVGTTKDLVEEFFGGAMGGQLAPALAEAAVPIAGSLALTGPVEDQLKKIPGIQEHTDLPGSGGDWFRAPFRMLGGDIMHPSRIASSEHLYDSNGNYIGPGSAAAAAAVPDTGTLGTVGATPPSMQVAMPSSSTTANEVEVQSNVATVTAGSVTLGGSISIPAGMMPSGGGVPRSAAGAGSTAGTSGGAAPRLGSTGGGGSVGGAGGAFRGFAQGGVLPGDSPGADNMIGVLPGGGMVGLEGGEGVIRPEAMRHPGMPDLLSNLNKHFDVGGTVPQGQAPSSGGQQQGPVTQNPIGTGQGAGVSGGIIGGAEQAGVMAAGMFGPAAQIAEQEMNLAIKKGTQLAANAATILPETLWLGGGQMGAPKLSSPLFGWPGKLLGGLIGSQTNLPNVAGATQPPKQPDDKDKQPGGDGQDAQKGGGPTGAKDDPMHVKSVDGAPPPPQGGTTNAANLTATMAPMP